MKVSEQLLKKIVKQFPQVAMQLKEQAQLRPVRGVNDGTHYKWSNGQSGENHLFSYHTMKECMVNEINICHHDSNDGNSGWEIYIKN